uniref:Rhodanese domain-containing protein n=1 Tax=Chrysotila carterae TaxID=13221 RepID=A0A7S4F1D9_CHRCT|mmetsp:Transcript_104/g.203  ORF Transcript_104/g.203 Transcript_104/m.203 type:complete len:237 (+) Transcript_104:349-1059(+)
MFTFTTRLTTCSLLLPPANFRRSLYTGSKLGFTKTATSTGAAKMARASQWRHRAPIARLLCTRVEAAARVAQTRVAERRAEILGNKAGESLAAWPEGLLSGEGAAEQGGTPIPAHFASELLFEVGWQSRHCFLDIRSADAFGAGRVRGALNVPFEPETTFLARAGAALDRLHHPNPPGKKARVIVGFGEHADAAAAVLLRAGYANTVRLEGGFEAWREVGFACEDGDSDEIEDSTF